MLLNELTNYGEFDLFGGATILHFVLVLSKASASHVFAMVVLMEVYIFIIYRHISGSKFTVPYAGEYY